MGPAMARSARTRRHNNSPTLTSGIGTGVFRTALSPVALSLDRMPCGIYLRSMRRFLFWMCCTAPGDPHRRKWVLACLAGYMLTVGIVVTGTMLYFRAPVTVLAAVAFFFFYFHGFSEIKSRLQLLQSAPAEQNSSKPPRAA